MFFVPQCVPKCLMTFLASSSRSETRPSCADCSGKRQVLETSVKSFRVFCFLEAEIRLLLSSAVSIQLSILSLMPHQSERPIAIGWQFVEVQEFYKKYS